MTREQTSRPWVPETDTLACSLSLPVKLGIASITTQISDFESLDNWDVLAGGVIALDNTRYTSGSSSIKLTSDAAGEGMSNDDFSVSIPASATYLSLSFYIEDTTKVSSLTIYLMSAVDDSKYFSFTTSTTGLSAGWNTLEIIKSQFTITGGITWSEPILKVVFRVDPAVAETAIVNFDNLFMANGATIPSVLMTFDDGFDEIYSEAFSYMASKNMVGTSYTISSLVGAAGRITEDQLIEMDADGWDIGNHTESHPDLTTLSDAQVQAELINCQEYIDGIGLTKASRHCAYPYGFFPTTINDAVIASTIAAGMLTGRATNSTWNSLPLAAPYKILIVRNFQTADTLVYAKGLIDIAKTAMLPCIFLIHTLGSGGENMTVANFEALIDYIEEQEMQTLTISELYRLQSNGITICHS